VHLQCNELGPVVMTCSQAAAIPIGLQRGGAGSSKHTLIQVRAGKGDSLNGQWLRCAGTASRALPQSTCMVHINRFHAAGPGDLGEK